MCALVGFCAANHGSFLPTFRYKLSFPSSTVKQSKKNGLRLFNPLDGTDRLSRNFGKKNYQSTLRKIPQERRAHLHRGGSLKSCITLGTTVQYMVGRGILCTAMLLHIAGNTVQTNYSGNNYPSTMLKICINIITGYCLTLMKFVVRPHQP